MACRNHLTLIIWAQCFFLVPFRVASQLVDEIEGCVSELPGPASLNVSQLERLYSEKNYSVLETTLPKTKFSGNGKLLVVSKEQATPVAQPLEGEIAHREDIVKVLEPIILAEFGNG
jgi:hypothetical protein